MTIEAFPLYWPEGWPRTEPYKRVKNPNFKLEFGRARDSLLHEVQLLGGRKVILSSNIPLRNDGLPYSNWRNPEDPGIAVYFDYKGKPMAFACDKFKYVHENARSIALTIEALRGIERWGASDMMERAFRGFVAIEDKTARPWWKVLGFDLPQFVSADDMEAAFKRLAMIHHPDKGGDAAKFQELTRARDEARRALER